MLEDHSLDEICILSIDTPPLIIQIRQRHKLGVIRPRRISLLPPLRSLHPTPNLRKRRRRDTRQPIRARRRPVGSIPEPGPGSSSLDLLRRRISVLLGFGNEEHPICGYRDDDYGDGGFDLEPEDDPGGVDLAVGGVAAAYADDADDHGEDAEAEDGAQSEFALETDFDAPEEEDWDCENLVVVSGRHHVELIWDLLTQQVAQEI